MTDDDSGRHRLADAGIRPAAPCLLVQPTDIEPFDRGNGVVTLPFVGKWNCDSNRVTTGMTTFAVGRALPLHTHNVEESVLVFAGEATAIIGEERFDLIAGQATWVPADVPHCFINRGDSPMTIYWVYGGRDITRTMCATGETFEHLSDSDRGATAAPGLGPAAGSTYSTPGTTSPDRTDQSHPRGTAHDDRQP